MSRKAKILLAFIAGQAVQVVAHVLAEVSYMARPVLFCIAAGFLIFAAVLAGVLIGVQDDKPKKSYADYAEGLN